MILHSRFEAFFENYMVMKGRNRNTAWLRITEEEWPEVNEIYKHWLDLALAGNHKSMSEMTAGLYGKTHRKSHKESFR